MRVCVCVCVCVCVRACVRHGKDVVIATPDDTIRNYLPTCEDVRFLEAGTAGIHPYQN